MSNTGKNDRERKTGDRFCFCCLASGSKGNALYVSDGETSILIDAGLSGADMERRFASKGLNPGNLDAIIVSHEHIDHVRGVGVLSRRYDIPVYATAKTASAAAPIIKKVNVCKIFSCGRSFSIYRLAIHPFSISHDAEDPVGFTVRHEDIKIGLATDLGLATKLVKEHLKECTLLMIEANHDLDMLGNGPYPWPLKQRIKSRSGHLSNADSKDLLNEIKHPHLKQVILGHLSEINNRPEKALAHVGSALEGYGARIEVAVQDTCGDLIFLT